jgi:hypothetical protein
MSFDATHDPVLSADFAERVLARADVVVSRRRRAYRVVGGTAALAFVSVAIVSWLSVSGMMQPPAPRVVSQSAALAGLQEEAQSGTPDVMDDLFPDAASLASFDSQYSDAAEGPDTNLLSEQDPAS